MYLKDGTIRAIEKVNKKITISIYFYLFYFFCRPFTFGLYDKLINIIRIFLEHYKSKLNFKKKKKTKNKRIQIKIKEF